MVDEVEEVLVLLLVELVLLFVVFVYDYVMYKYHPARFIYFFFLGRPLNQKKVKDES